jgi:hypothetical protein
MTTPIRIDNCIVRETRSGRGSIVETVRSYLRSHPADNIDVYPRVTLGHRILDNRLLQYVMDGRIAVEELLQPNVINALPFPIGEPPIIIPHPRYSVYYSYSFVLK